MASVRELRAAFKRVRLKPYGAKFHKVDLHFHTPGSADARGKNRYGFNPYKIAYPKNTHSWSRTLAVRNLQTSALARARALAEQVVERALAERLSVLAITDHNALTTIWSDADAERGSEVMDLAAPTWYELVNDAAELRNRKAGKPLLSILPGVEISTAGVHILAIFAPSQPTRTVHFKICTLLTEIGFAVEEFGKNPKVGRVSVLRTLELVRAYGGLPIIAHIDGSDQSLLSLHEIKSGAMKAVLTDPALAGVEMVRPSRLARPQAKLRNKSLGDWITTLRGKAGLEALTYFQGSDAHDLSSIGKRFTYVKMTSPSFTGLESAVQSPGSRVRVGDLHEPPEHGIYIYGAEFEHPLFGTQQLRFNPHLNCVVGRKDCGKSLLLRLVHEVLDDETQLDLPFKLFIERREAGRSRHYCFSRRRSGVCLHRLEPAGKSWSFERVEEDDPAFVELRPRAYRSRAMEALIESPDLVERFLVSRNGPATKQRAAELDERMSSTRFLCASPSPLLAVSRTKRGRYQIKLNLNWRQSRAKFVDFFRLSKSRRRLTIIAVVMLCERGGPLIIDEPGDHFDSEDIVRFFVPLLKLAKNSRQIILATHNSNVMINSDPENYIVLEAGDRGQSTLRSGFAIDDARQRAELIELTEGTLASFEKRGRRYKVAASKPDRR